MPGLLDMPNEVLESIFLDAAYHGSSLDADICLSLSEPKRRLESSSLSVISRKTQDLAVSVLWKHLRVVATSVEDINRLISLVDGTFFNEDEESLDVNEQWMLRRRPKGHLVSHLSLHHLYDQHQVFGYQTMCTLMLSCNNMRFLTIRDSTVPNTPSLVRCLLTIAPRLTTFYTDFTSSTTLKQPQSIFDEKEYFDSLMGACSQLRYFSIRPQSSLDICADPDLSRPLDLFDFSTSAIDPGTYSMIVKAVSHAKAVSINFNIDDQFYEETSFPLKDVLNEILEAKSDELKSLTLAHQICPIYVTLPSRSRLCRTTFPSLTSLTLMGECFCRIYINNPQILPQSLRRLALGDVCSKPSKVLNLFKADSIPQVQYLECIFNKEHPNWDHKGQRWVWQDPMISEAKTTMSKRDLQAYARRLGRERASGVCIVERFCMPD